MNCCSEACGWCGRCTTVSGDEPHVTVRGFCQLCGWPLAWPHADPDGIVRCPVCRLTHELEIREAQRQQELSRI